MFLTRIITFDIMEESNYQQDKQLKYQYAGVITFDLLFGNILKAMPEKEERLGFIQNLIEGFLVWIDFDDPDMESAEATAKALEIDWDDGMFLCYIDNYGSPDFTDLINDEEVNIGLMGMVSGIHTVIDSLKELHKILVDGKDLDALYTIEKFKGEGLSFLNTNVEDLKHKKSLVYTDLVNSYHEKLLSSFTDKELIVETDIKEFSRLFTSGQSNSEWDYLSERLMMPVEEINEIYENRNAVINGTYVFTFYSLDTDKRLIYAILLAIRDYINYIREEISQPKPYDGFKKVPTDRDDRILLSESATEHVEICFMELSLDINGNESGEPLMTEEDIKYFLQSNFVNFGDKYPRKKFNIGVKPHKLLKTHLGCFIVKVLSPFINREGCYISREMIKNLLKNNFIVFENDSDYSINKLYNRDVYMPSHLEKIINKKIG